MTTSDEELKTCYCVHDFLDHVSKPGGLHKRIPLKYRIEASHLWGRWHLLQTRIQDLKTCEAVVKDVRKVLYSYLDPKLTPGLPRPVREQTCKLLRYYPVSNDFRFPKIPAKYQVKFDVQNSGPAWFPSWIESSPMPNP